MNVEEIKRGIATFSEPEQSEMIAYLLSICASKNGDGRKSTQSRPVDQKGHTTKPSQSTAGVFIR